MRIKLSAKELGLSPRTVIEQLEEDRIALVMKRKSRIIMADGRNIVTKGARIRAVYPKVRVVLETNAPVCSKTIIYLKENNIELLPADE